jgi:hypothetical protein
MHHDQVHDDQILHQRHWQSQAACGLLIVLLPVSAKSITTRTTNVETVNRTALTALSLLGLLQDLFFPLLPHLVSTALSTSESRHPSRTDSVSKPGTSESSMKTSNMTQNTYNGGRDLLLQLLASELELLLLTLTQLRDELRLGVEA